jgi:hypothetical protein
MPSKIVLKNSVTTTAVPTTGDLTVQGEVALNLTDKRLFARDGSNAVVLIGIQDGSSSGNTIVWDGDDWVETPRITVSGGNVGLNGSGDITINFDGNVIMTGLPTADPEVAGAIWSNSSVLTVSAG